MKQGFPPPRVAKRFEKQYWIYRNLSTGEFSYDRPRRRRKNEELYSRLYLNAEVAFENVRKLNENGRRKTEHTPSRIDPGKV